VRVPRGHQEVNAPVPSDAQLGDLGAQRVAKEPNPAEGEARPPSVAARAQGADDLRRDHGLGLDGEAVALGTLRRRIAEPVDGDDGISLGGQSPGHGIPLGVERKVPRIAALGDAMQQEEHRIRAVRGACRTVEPPGDDQLGASTAQRGPTAEDTAEDAAEDAAKEGAALNRHMERDLVDQHAVGHSSPDTPVVRLESRLDRSGFRA
jgi:hypothetical protein